MNSSEHMLFDHKHLNVCGIDVVALQDIEANFKQLLKRNKLNHLLSRITGKALKRLGKEILGDEFNNIPVSRFDLCRRLAITNEDRFVQICNELIDPPGEAKKKTRAEKFSEMTTEEVFEFVTECMEKWEARIEVLNNEALSLLEKRPKRKTYKWRRYDTLASPPKYSDWPVQGPWVRADEILPFDLSSPCLVFMPIGKNNITRKVHGPMVVAYYCGDEKGWVMANQPTHIELGLLPWYWIYLHEINKGG